MKTKFYFASLFLTICIWVIPFLNSCEKEKEIGLKNEEANLKNEMISPSSSGFNSPQEIDAVSREIADYHYYALVEYMNDHYCVGDSFDNTYLQKVNNFAVDAFYKYDFSHVSKSYSKSIAKSTIQKTIDFDFLSTVSLMSRDDMDFTLLSRYDQHANAALVDEKCKLIISVFEKIFYTSKTLEEFEYNYYLTVDQELAEMRSGMKDYMSVRFFADMCMSSFKGWCTYFYEDKGFGELSFKAANVSWWDKVKQRAAAVWTEIKPLVKADAAGAVVGGLVGAAAGGIGAGPGAGITALGASLEKGINR